MGRVYERAPSAEEIRRTREEAGLTEKEAAELIEFDLSTWRGWEKGTHSMHRSYWNRFNEKLEQIRVRRDGGLCAYCGHVHPRKEPA